MAEAEEGLGWVRTLALATGAVAGVMITALIIHLARQGGE